ncbi:MAG TPA: hypothetical protein VE243_07250 [Candidatus Acidoferrum sp.]|nr:hypothetical protein [Candidatus Acidoferrum sp.]
MAIAFARARIGSAKESALIIGAVPLRVNIENASRDLRARKPCVY